MKIRIPDKLRVEDFDSNMQDTIGKIAKIYNQFTDSVYRTLNGNVDFGNLSRQLISIDIITDASGQLINPPKIKLTIPNKINGLHCISAINLIKSNSYPTSAPFISYSVNNSILSIDNISGIPASSQFRLTIEIL